MKMGPIPGINIQIHIGHPVTPEAPVGPLKPTIHPDVVKARLENMRKGREKKKFNSDTYPKVVSHNKTPEGTDLKPKPRMGYYN